MKTPDSGNKFTMNDVISCIGDGWIMFWEIPGISIAYASIFASIGLVLLGGVGMMGLSPMALPFAGGFMLVGPILLSGFFKIADHYNDDKESVHLSDAVFALKQAPAQLWVISLVCTMLFLVWITDAATLYAIMIRDVQPPWSIEIESNIIAYELWGSLMGSVLAFIIFAISAFSVPLIYQARANLISAVTLSVKTVFGNFISSIFWGILLSVLTIISIIILPLFIITLPVLAFASYSLYKRIFPIADNIDAIN
jgi:uncharacterized membrane protein